MTVRFENSQDLFNTFVNIRDARLRVPIDHHQVQHSPRHAPSNFIVLDFTKREKHIISTKYDQSPRHESRRGHGV